VVGLAAGVFLLILVGGLGARGRIGFPGSLPSRLPGQPTGAGVLPIDGVPCQPGEQAGYHVHAYLTIRDHGRRLEIPAGVGVVDPAAPEPDGSIATGACLYWLHTHDASGTVHVEAPMARPFTLGQFFDVWGQPLSADDVAGIRGAVNVRVDGQPYLGDPRAIVLDDGETIAIEVGAGQTPTRSLP
jgi:hypothetical protein